MMESHQTGQEEKLVEAKLDMDCLDAVHLPRAPPASCHSCFTMVAVATAIGLLTGTLVGGLYVFFNMQFPPTSDEAKCNVSVICTLEKRGEHGAYDIFTVAKPATYLIYGWVKLADNATAEVTLRQTWKGGSRDIEKKTGQSTVFFFAEALMVDNVSISIHFKAAFTDSLFHIYELRSH